ncbi:hypothetical protein P775_15200 [Puniceibacterium antarcticum]|uniref:Uncharacterized protein n=1 Tax=Puniceibacterium antarcticum TaxID=1206336 RepID=A0A2G8RD36_9RHOB|nr:hypothetical protein P775_15200 [Puniceibacterium antarcticum]
MSCLGSGGLPPCQTGRAFGRGFFFFATVGFAQGSGRKHAPRQTGHLRPTQPKEDLYFQKYL